MHSDFIGDQTLILISALDDTTNLPFGVKTLFKISSWCPLKHAKKSPVTPLSKYIQLSLPPQIMALPFGCQSTNNISSVSGGP